MAQASKRFSSVLVIAAVSGVLAACAPASTEASVTFRQSQAVESFDNSTHSTTDEDRIEELVDILDEYDIAGDYESELKTCDGGMTTFVEYTTSSGAKQTLDVQGCDMTEFENALTDLVTRWREED